ncbi:PD-(D/E)XK motif protein [Corynebacterium sp. NPDC060344]|uniref:PD-(D/E)XK motif protein n=1 Tax=Corynebacterium sp. NPDC060344 TaxID=3347101 RepID=UPI00365F46F8
MNAAKFSDLWAELDRPATGEFTMGFVAETRIRLAVDQEGQHHVLIPAGNYNCSIPHDGDSLRTRIHPVGVDRLRYESHLDIYCVNPSLTRAFDRLAAALIEVAGTSTDPVHDALKCLGEWKNLFIDRRRRSLTPQQRIGIFAELGVLKDFVDAQQIVETSAWTGPSKAPHDFEFDTMSLEVKAYGAGSDQVTFHGPLQLDTIEGKPLYLCLRQVEEDEAGNTLLELAQEIEDQVEDPQRFRTTLNKIGVLDDDEALEHYRYSVVRESLFEVNEQTPRIVASSFADGEFPAAIERLRYSIEPEDLITGDVFSNIDSWLSEVGE